MSRHHHHSDLETAAKVFGMFMVIAGVLWLVVSTYGTILLPVIGVWLYRRRTGSWPGRRRGH